MRLATACVTALALLGLTTPADAHVYIRSYQQPIVIPDNSLTVAGLFDQTGMLGRAYKIVVRIHGLSHGAPADLDVAISALGVQTMLMSDVGNDPVASLDLRFDECATRVPLAGSGGYHPYNNGSSEAHGQSSSLADFTGVNPNTTWQLRFSDDTANGIGGSATGWDLIVFTEEADLGQKRSVGCETPDFDGDGRMDFAVYRETTGQYLVQQSSDAQLVVTNLVPAGVTNGDVAIPADYDGDGITDLAVFRRASATWHVRRSTTGVTSTVQGGAPGDQPIPADIDHDGHTDLALFRPSTAQWFWLSSLTGQITVFQGGVPGLDKPARRP